MKKYSSLFLLLWTISITILFVLTYLSKSSKRKPPINLVMYNKDYNVMTNDNNNNLNKFWNNFPYLVSLSENKILDSSAVLFSSNGEKTNFYNIISPNSYTLFLRYNIKGEKIENIVKVIDSLGLGNYLYIIVDNENYKKYFQKRSPDFHKVLILDDDMNLYIDQANFSYIFYTTRNFRIKCIYVPRSEVPSMYIEYLKYLKDSILIKK